MQLVIVDVNWLPLAVTAMATVLPVKEPVQLTLTANDDRFGRTYVLTPGPGTMP